MAEESGIIPDTSADIIEALEELNDDFDADLKLFAETPHGSYLFHVLGVEAREVGDETVAVLKLRQVER